MKFNFLDRYKEPQCFFLLSTKNDIAFGYINSELFIDADNDFLILNDYRTIFKPGQVFGIKLINLTKLIDYKNETF